MDASANAELSRLNVEKDNAYADASCPASNRLDVFLGIFLGVFFLGVFIVRDAAVVAPTCGGTSAIHRQTDRPEEAQATSPGAALLAGGNLPHAGGCPGRRRARWLEPGFSTI